MFMEKKQENNGIENQQNSKKPLDIQISASKDEYIQSVKNLLHSSSDLMIKFLTDDITIVYLDFLVDGNTLNEHILNKLDKSIDRSPISIKEKITISEIDISNQLDNCIYAMLNGAVLIHIEGHEEIVIAKISSLQTRSLSVPENESLVIGSQIGFNESLSTNVSLVRRYIVNPELCNEKYSIGKKTNTSLSILYIHGIAPEDHVNTVRQRITDLDISDLIDSSELVQLIDDSSLSIFPQMLLTERPDRFCEGLLSGKVGIVVNGSTMAILCPYTFVEFFQSREDQNLRWQISTFLRLLRFIAIFISVFATPIYVAALTFHYEIIPQPLLVPLSESRAIVPFPPIIEALFLELIIELLREAGARLPTKIGQTIGIVGGIVLGTAAVQAGITSNILIIIIALGALSSFATPNYTMGNVIRILRFPIIILAGIWGFYGIMIAFCIMLIHLLRQTSLGAPYMAPFYPPRWKDWTNSIVRMPFPFINRQSVNSRKNRK